MRITGIAQIGTFKDARKPRALTDKKVALRFAQVLRAQRNNRRLTQERLAELADLSVEHIQRLEGKAPSGIRLETIVKLSKALKTTPSGLLRTF